MQSSECRRHVQQVKLTPHGKDTHLRLLGKDWQHHGKGTTNDIQEEDRKRTINDIREDTGSGRHKDFQELEEEEKSKEARGK